MPFNDVAKNAAVDAFDETSSTAAPITHIGILAAGTDPGTGTNHAAPRHPGSHQLTDAARQSIESRLFHGWCSSRS